MLIYSLTEDSHYYSKHQEKLWQYYRDDPALDVNNAITDFLTDNKNSALFKFKTKIAGKIENDDTKEVKIPLKYLSNFWRTLEIPIINCEINLFLTWSMNCFTVS